MDLTILSKEFEGIKIGKFLRSTSSTKALFPSIKQTKSAFHSKEVTVNNNFVSDSYKLQVNDYIVITRTNETVDRLRNEVKDLPIFFQDEFLAVVWKASGLTLCGQKEKTLQSSLKFNLIPSKSSLKLENPEIIGEFLDKATSGFVICSKTKDCSHKLTELMMDQTTQVKYVFTGLVNGNFGDNFSLKENDDYIIETEIDNSPCKTLVRYISSHQTRNTTSGWISLIKASPIKFLSHKNKSFVKHQVKITLKNVGFPILGSSKYCDYFKQGVGTYYQLNEIEFYHPLKIEILLSFKKDIPSKFLLLLEREKKFFERKLEEEKNLLMNYNSEDLDFEFKNVYYMLGKKDFFHLNYDVSSAVMVPRQGTEALVQTSLDLLPKIDTPSIFLDLGTGSACILISILKNSNTYGYGLDISPDALKIALLNVKNHECQSKCMLIESDFQTIKLPPFTILNLIVSNPPYLTPTKSKTFDRIGEEPDIALFSSDEKGLQSYLDIKMGIEKIPDNLAATCFLVVEIGNGMKEKVIKVFKNSSRSLVIFEFFKVVKDFKALERCLVFKISKIKN